MGAPSQSSMSYKLLEASRGPGPPGVPVDPLGDVIYRRYAVWRVFDVMIILGTVGLGACYAIARHLGHVGVWCDISDLVRHLPERVLFRLDFAVLGVLLAFSSLIIYDLTAARAPGILPKAAAVGQFLSGVGVVLVGACGPEEINKIHETAATLGFGGSAVAQ